MPKTDITTTLAADSEQNLRMVFSYFRDPKSYFEGISILFSGTHLILTVSGKGVYQLASKVLTLSGNLVNPYDNKNFPYVRNLMYLEAAANFVSNMLRHEGVVVETLKHDDGLHEQYEEFMHLPHIGIPEDWSSPHHHFAFEVANKAEIKTALANFFTQINAFHNCKDLRQAFFIENSGKELKGLEVMRAAIIREGYNTTVYQPCSIAEQKLISKCVEQAFLVNNEAYQSQVLNCNEIFGDENLKQKELLASQSMLSLWRDISWQQLAINHFLKGVNTELTEQFLQSLYDLMFNNEKLKNSTFLEKFPWLKQTWQEQTLSRETFDLLVCTHVVLISLIVYQEPNPTITAFLLNKLMLASLPKFSVLATGAGLVAAVGVEIAKSNSILAGVGSYVGKTVCNLGGMALTKYAGKAIKYCLFGNSTEQPQAPAPATPALEHSYAAN